MRLASRNQQAEYGEQGDTSSGDADNADARNGISGARYDHGVKQSVSERFGWRIPTP